MQWIEKSRRRGRGRGRGKVGELYIGNMVHSIDERSRVNEEMGGRRGAEAVDAGLSHLTSCLDRGIVYN